MIPLEHDRPFELADAVASEFDRPPVGLENVRKTQGKRKGTAPVLAKWLAHDVTEADWRKLPAAAKVFLLDVIQAVGRVNM